MGMKHVFGAVLVTAGFATGMAAPAAAEPSPGDLNNEQIDQIFAKAVSDKGFRISEKRAIEIAHSTCDTLGRGGSVSDALRHLKNETGWEKPQDLTTFGGLVVQAYCPTSAPPA